MLVDEYHDTSWTRGQYPAPPPDLTGQTTNNYLCDIKDLENKFAAQLIFSPCTSE